jgi:hypothetical protein
MVISPLDTALKARYWDSVLPDTSDLDSPSPVFRRSVVPAKKHTLKRGIPSRSDLFGGGDKFVDDDHDHAFS